MIRRAIETRAAIRPSTCGNCPADGSVVGVRGCVDGVESGAVREMPDTFIVVIPDSRLVRLIGSDTGVAVTQVDRRVGGVRERRNFDPVVNSTGRGNISLHFMIELRGAVRVGSEDDIMAVRVLNVTAVGGGGEV